MEETPPVAEEPEMTDEATTETANIEAIEIAPGLTARILREGDGATAQAGDNVEVHYTGWLCDGSGFPNSDLRPPTF